MPQLGRFDVAAKATYQGEGQILDQLRGMPIAQQANQLQ